MFEISYSCYCDVGRIREINQDNFVCDGMYLAPGEARLETPLYGKVTSEKGSLFGVFDGMGGEECGEIASLIAADMASLITVGKDPVDDLTRFCSEANDAICDFAAANSVSSMGTTCAMIAFNDENITMCNVGDSKVFLFSDGILNQISKDHISPAPFGMKPPLSQNLGIPKSEMIVTPYFSKGEYASGDVILICSDGLTDMMPVGEIERVLRESTPSEALGILVNGALAAGGKDNITVIILEIKKEPGFIAKMFGIHDGGTD